MDDSNTHVANEILVEEATTPIVLQSITSNAMDITPTVTYEDFEWATNFYTASPIRKRIWECHSGGLGLIDQWMGVLVIILMWGIPLLCGSSNPSPTSWTGY